MTDAEPTRLKDDPATSDALRHDLGLVSAQPIAAFDVENGLLRLRAAIAAGGGPAGGQHGGGGTTAPTGSIASGLSSGAVAGIAVVGLLAVGALVVVVVATRDPGTEAVAPRAVAWSASPPSGSVERTPPPSPAPAPVPVAPEPRPIAPAIPADEAPEREPRRERDRDRESPRARGARDDDSVRREIEHMAQLRRALRGDPARALALANAGQQEFRRGQLVEEREAIAVLALARLGRHAEVERRGGRFLRRYPRSAFAERIARQVRGP